MTFWRLALAYAAAVAAGCGSVATVESPPASKNIERFDAARSAEAAKNQDLLYVGGSNGAFTSILTYPKLQVVGKLRGHATGLCSDTHGNVYVTTWSARPPSGAILKYAHGGTKPIETLSDGYRPVGCAVDPKTGDLAVADLGTLSARETNVAIWRQGRGMPAYWSDASFEFFMFCGYDDRGNLFADGVDKANDSVFAELPKNGTFENVSLSQSIEAPGSIQWDGAYVTIADTKAHEIFRFAFANYFGTLEGSTVLTGWQIPRSVETWIAGSTAIAPFGPTDAREIGLWNYPNGGSVTKRTGAILRNGWVQTVTLSVAPSSTDKRW